MSLEIALNYLEEAGDLSRSCQVEAHFKKIAANPGKAGEAYLMQAMNDIDTGVSALVKACIVLAQCPFVTFGVGALTVPQPHEYADDGSEQPWHPGLVGLFKGLALRWYTGHAARDQIDLHMGGLNLAGRELLYRCLVKELRIGCGPKTINKYHKGLVLEWELAGAKRTKEALHKVPWPAWADYKIDGFRSLVKTDGQDREGLETYSRNGLPMENMQYRAADLHDLTRYLIAAGLLENIHWAWDMEGKKMDARFNATQSEASKKGKGAELTGNIFDLIPWAHVRPEGGTEPIEVRHERLDKVQTFLAENADFFPMLRVVERFELDTEADAWELFAQAKELGHEGLIVKQKGSFWTPGKTDAWVKVKPEETADVLCVGTYMGEPGSKFEHVLGGITIIYNGVKTNVGSGLSDKQREDWAKQPDLVVGHVVEVLYHEITPDGALREVRLSKKGIRHDKHPEQADGRLESRND